ncbi:hypothetical protein [Extibacter muris]|uniref:hypothetical protein n=1 Tax=Extibacter muris TaxID=1796622 RepID=UPI0011AE3F6A|nr:hypothetical protein [Extibacter muris]
MRRGRTSICPSRACGALPVALWRVEYQKPGKAIVNPSTQKKLEEYLKEEFLEKIRQFIMG